MNSLTNLPVGNLYQVPTQSTFGLTIDLALTTGIKLLVCGNRLPFYEIAYALAYQVGQRYSTILRENIFFSRAETCIQLVDFLSEMEAGPLPLLVTDMLSRFNDEDDDQIDELFFICQVELERVSKAALVFVNAAPRPPQERLGCVLARITQELDL